MKKNSSVAVCVTQQKTCERLIKVGVKIREKTKGELYVLHVAPEGFNFLGNSKEGEALEYLFDISKAADAQMIVLRSSKIIETIDKFCKDNEISKIILGESQERKPEKCMIPKLRKKLKKSVEIEVIPT
ncbi:MAG: universal stress protein UspA [Alkaliphilus sp.]